MKSFKVIILMFLSMHLFSNNLLSQWNIQVSGTQQILRNIFPIDSLKVWAVGDSGAILYTSDGGNKWMKQISNTGHNLRSVSFCDSLNGWAVGDGGMKLMTRDGGQKWNQIFHDTADNIFNRKVTCFDTNNVLISRNAWYGDYYGGGKIWHWLPDSVTICGGSGWFDISPNSHSGLIFQIDDFDFVSETVGYATKMDGLNYDWVSQISKTTDGGCTWVSHQIPSIGKISFSDSQNGFLINWGNVYRYIDTINTFNQIKSFKANYYGESVCNIGDFVYISSDSSIMKSTDGGLTWTRQPINKRTLYDIKFITPENGWAVGDDGLILHTSNGGVMDVNNNDNLQSFSFELYQNYPNPFNPTTTIKYKIQKRSIVKIVIFDILGRELETLVNEEKPAGIYTVKFNARNLSSGIYFYKLQIAELIHTKKFLLLK